jgi:hypothetical protein
MKWFEIKKDSCSLKKLKVNYWLSVIMALFMFLIIGSAYFISDKIDMIYISLLGMFALFR